MSDYRKLINKLIDIYGDKIKVGEKNKNIIDDEKYT